jgi:rhamnulose-1-phosphate aldolase/alcohol dehydrogenase
MKNLWRDEEVRDLVGVDLLVHRSRLIGVEPDLVVWGGGNTSIKQTEADFRGRSVRVMRIKRTGSDLKTAERNDFPGIRLEDLDPLRERRSMSDDEVVAYLAHCLMEPGSARPSIEALLHGFVPHDHVDHTHADAILALTNTADGKRHVKDCFGRDAIWIPYRRPGFVLSREVGEALRGHSEARCAVLEMHGLITWGATSKESYDTTIEMTTRAEEHARRKAQARSAFGPLVHKPLPPATRRRVAAAVAAYLRGLLSRVEEDGARVILRFDDGEDILDLAGSEAGFRLCLTGPATPDHLLYTRPHPLLLQRDLPSRLDCEEGIGALKRALATGLEDYVSAYDRYFDENNDGRTDKLERRPRIVLIPGVGMFTAWKDARHALMVADIYHHSIRVMRDAQALGTYRSLGAKATFDVEYWPSELYKLGLEPPEREFGRRAAMVTGAASGIGRAIARQLAGAGCHVVAVDIDLEGVRSLADEITTLHGNDRARGVRMDVSDERSVEAAFQEAVLAYGGIDVVVSNAGIAHSSPIDKMALEDWQRSFQVNATGHFLVGRAAVRVLKDQGLGGSLIFIASKNVLAPGKEFGAYSAAKAAECQLARILALETGEHGVRVNMVNPDAVFQESNLWSPKVREERARAHGIGVDQLEDFYRRRNLLQARVLPEDVAEAVLWLASDRSAKTTGCIITTDGGIREAFPR